MARVWKARLTGSANRTRDAADRIAVPSKFNLRIGGACRKLRSLAARLELGTAVMQDSRRGYMRGVKVRYEFGEKVR
jgi:hypothetical protein